MAPGKPRIEPGLVAVRHQRLDVDPVGLGDGALELERADEHRTALLGEELGGVVADVAEALDDDPLALDPGLEADRLHVLSDAADLAQREENAAAGRLDAAVDTALGDRLGGDAGERVDVVWRERGVGVGDPGHLPRTGREVRRGDIEGGSDEVLAEQLEGEPARDPLELVDRVAAGIDLHPSLGTAERHVDDRALVGHQCRERRDLVLVDRHRIAQAALGGQTVLAVLGAPRVHDLDRTIVALDGEGEVDQAVDVFDLVEQSGRLVNEGRGLVEVADDLVEEAQRLGHGDLPSSRSRWLVL